MEVRCPTYPAYVPEMRPVEKERTDDVPSVAEARAPPVKRQPNENIDSFDAVLEAMEKELEKERAKQPLDPEPADMDVDEDELNEEDAELLQHLLASGNSIPESLQHFAQTHDASSTDINALGSFLESFKAQAGLPGPVSNLAGRFGIGALPRDADSLE